MSTRARRVAKSASLPRVVRRLCSKCGVVHVVPMGKKCKQLSRALFPADLADENAPDVSNNRTSTPNTEGTVNHIVSPIVAPLVTSEVVQTAAGTSVVGVRINSPPSAALGVSDKLDHLANAVSALCRSLLHNQ